jgi:D-tagatose-1,6-bisphosphate aldolase subunit GatZ/KbaZ
MKTNFLLELRNDHLSGRRGGRVAICSSRREVLEAAVELAMSRDDHLLVEVTANQVNQYGGYSGMTPAAFASEIDRLALAMGFPRSRILLGADHLGPYIWRNEPVEKAMRKSLELVQQCVRAGFSKIHLDTGFGCADDPRPELPPEIAAERAATLCRAAESVAEQLPPAVSRPLYVIGAEVPPPGGALDDPRTLEVTSVERLEEALRRYGAQFKSAHLESAWDRVMAIVVQPGVEFGDCVVARYCSERARALSCFHDRLPAHMTYEVHSTDYQPSDSLARMVADHFTLLKVGPCLTHAFREAVLGLARIESEQLDRRREVQRSNIREVLEAVMLEDPVHWRSHYRGNEEDLRFLRFHSQRDRLRYYWSQPAVAIALKRLLANLKPGLSPAWVEAQLPEVYAALPTDRYPIDPTTLIRRHIQLTLKPYFDACA